ncbi:hypothetical protein LC574_23520 [Nostoc sp. CHAB 5715]|nr:hypothetical protein [Nostoc sp. CHAB 5715]
MTSAISKELQFLAGHDFYVKLTPMSIAVPLQKIWFLTQYAWVEERNPTFPGLCWVALCLTQPTISGDGVAQSRHRTFDLNV